MYTLFGLKKRAEKRPTTQTFMAALRRSYVIKNWIVTKSKGSYIQQISLWLIWYVYQVLHVASHRWVIPHLHIRWKTTIYHYSYRSTSLTIKCDFRLFVHLTLSANHPVHSCAPTKISAHAYTQKCVRIRAQQRTITTNFSEQWLRHSETQNTS